MSDNTYILEEILLAMQDKTILFRDNISKLERKALKLLKERINSKEIIITRADKGSGLVIVDYDTYISKGTKYIEQEAKAYIRVQKTEQNIIGRLIKIRNKLVEQLKDKNIISAQTAVYIKKQLEEKIIGVKFYYKIHKDNNIYTMPLRPLQSCIKASTQYLSIVLTDILQPLLKTENIPSFILDSNQLLYRLYQLGNILRDCTLISSDVSTLYPSIPHVDGFKTMISFLREKTDLSPVQIISIIRALELIITENYINWNRQIYK